MADTIEIVQGTATVVEVAGPTGPQGPSGNVGATGATGPQGPAGTGIETLTTKGDLLSRDDSGAIRVGIGSTGQVLKVSAQGLPSWANESGAVTSVNGATGAVTVAAATHGANHYDSGDLIYNEMVRVDDAGFAGVNGVYYVADDGGDYDFIKIGSRSLFKLVFEDSRWKLKRQDTTYYQSQTYENATQPWNATGWTSISSQHNPVPSVLQADAVYAVDNLARNTQFASGLPVLGSTGNLPVKTGSGGVIEAGGFGVPVALAEAAAEGTSASFARADHVHPWPTANQIGAVAIGNDFGDLGDIAECRANLGLGTSATKDAPATGNASSSQVVLGNDSRLSDSRTPTAHAASHASSGSDPVTLDPSQIVSASGLPPVWLANDSLAGVFGSFGDAVLSNTTDFAAASHTHGNLTNDGKIGSTAGLPVVTTTAGAVTALALGTANQILRVNSGATAVEFADPAASGVTGAASSASDVLGVSGSNITGVDANADRLIFWDDSASALKHLTVGSGLSLTDTTLTATATGTIGGSTSTDNAIVRADSTSNTVQDSALVIDDATTSTQANVALRNNHSETNSALVLTPKGTGAFIVGPRPDGTATGGNARGSGAICIQTSRTAATQVASTTDSIAIGNRSTSSSSIGESVAIGPATTASGQYSTCVGGRATATNTYACAFGHDADATGASGSIAVGDRTTASGTSSIAIGTQSTASGAYAVALGTQCTATGSQGIQIGSFQSHSIVLGVGINATPTVRAQFATLPFSAVYWSGQTTTNAATILNLDGASPSRFTIAASTALAVDILLVARRATTQDKWLVARRFLGIRRDGSNNTSLIGTVQTLGTDQSAGSPTWTFALTADDTNEALQLEVTGATGETVEWRATAFYRVA